MQIVTVCKVRWYKGFKTRLIQFYIFFPDASWKQNKEREGERGKIPMKVLGICG